MRRVLATAALPIAMVVVSGSAGAETAEREQAAALSARATDGDPAAIRALIPLINDPDSKVRYHAYWGLARAGAPAVALLVDEFRRLRDDESRGRVASVLGRIGLAARVAMPDMREALQDPDSSTGVQAASALGAMQAREAVPDLVRAYARSRRTTAQAQIARALLKIGSDQGMRSAKSQLVASLRDDLSRMPPDAAAHDYALTLLRASHDDSGDQFPTLAELGALIPEIASVLDDPDVARVGAAVRALTLVGAAASPAVPRLARLLGHRELHHDAMKALRAIGTPEALRIVEERLALEKLEKRIRTEYVVGDHLGRTWLLPFSVLGSAEDGVRLSVRLLYPGPELRRPDRVVINLESTSAEPRLAAVETVTWLADGHAIEMVDLGHSLSSSRIGVIERLSGSLSVADFVTLAAARELTARVGPVAFSLTQPDQSALRHLAARIPEASPARQAP